jgi:hypothetical protein
LKLLDFITLPEGGDLLFTSGHGAFSLFDFDVHFKQHRGLVVGRLLLETSFESLTQLGATDVVFESDDTVFLGLACFGGGTGKGFEVFEGSAFLVVVGHAQVVDDAKDIGGFGFVRRVFAGGSGRDDSQANRDGETTDGELRAILHEDLIIQWLASRNQPC